MYWNTRGRKPKAKAEEGLIETWDVLKLHL